MQVERPAFKWLGTVFMLTVCFLSIICREILMADSMSVTVRIYDAEWTNITAATTRQRADSLGALFITRLT